jgi:hypothetical protein
MKLQRMRLAFIPPNLLYVSFASKYEPSTPEAHVLLVGEGSLIFDTHPFLGVGLIPRANDRHLALS